MFAANDKPNTTHYLYTETQKARTTWSDIMQGTLRLREKGKDYLPQFPAELDASYKDRLSTATLVNMSEKTRDIMVGLVFQGEIELGEDVAPEIIPLAEDIDNAGTHLNVFARSLFEDQFAGWSVVLVDSPSVRVETRADEKALRLRPYWVKYTADQVINWRYRINPVSKAKELTLIVFKEQTNEPAGMFANEIVTRYRAFSLNDAGQVEYRLYRQTGETGIDTVFGPAEFVLEAEGIIPRLTKIPVGICGKGLGAKPPLTDIALKNIEHYQTYSDFKSLMHKSCVPLPFVKNLSMNDNQQLIVSADKLTELSSDGDIGWAEVSGTALAPIRQTLQDIRDEIALIGLSLLADSTARVEVTATEALLNSAGETAALRVMATSLKDCLELCLGHTAELLGLPRERGGSITLGTSWNISKDKITSDYDLLERIARFVNSLTGVMPQEWLIQFVLQAVGVTDEARLAELLRQLRSETAIVFDDFDTGTAPELAATEGQAR